MKDAGFIPLSYGKWEIDKRQGCKGEGQDKDRLPGMEDRRCGKIIRTKDSGF